jgi:hypothetical protein
MNCENHPDREGVAACVSCGKVICGECRLKLAGKNYCQECADELVEGKQKQYEESEQTIKETYLEQEPYHEPEAEPEPETYERKYTRGMPRPRKEEAPKKNNTFLLFCVAFLVTLIIVGVILYAAYVIYLAPHYGDLNSLINQILNNPRGVINSLGL